MSTNQRKAIFEELVQLSHLSPEMRLGQLLACAAALGVLGIGFVLRRIRLRGLIRTGGNWFLDALVLELQFADQVRVMNEENGPIIRLFRPRHHFQQPLRGFEFLRMMPEFPRRHDFQRHIARAADLEQGIARHRVK